MKDQREREEEIRRFLRIIDRGKERIGGHRATERRNKERRC